MSAELLAGIGLPQAAGERLAARVQTALRRARRSGRLTLASVTFECPVADPTASAVASRLPGEPWCCLEQPQRAGLAVAALGAVHGLEASGPGRFSTLSARWRRLIADAAADPPAAAPGSGLAAFGGFAFADDGGGSAWWRGFAPASLIVPELVLTRFQQRSWATVNVALSGDDTLEGALSSVARRWRAMRHPPLPLLDPEPVAATSVRSAMAPSHYEEAVARAVARIRAGELDKVVLARAVEVRAAAAHDPGALLGVLRDAFPSCYVYCVGRGDGVFIGATPELLVRREGQRASTVALAGSTRRSADPAVDAHLGEQLLRSAKNREENAIVAQRISEALRPHAVWVAAEPEPSLVRVANIQHLAVAIRAQLARPLGAIELAELLHPTPAVGGDPRGAALEAIPALEGLDRGWYAGPVGWVDSTEDGEFCVALRCALLRGGEAVAWAGCGIVRDSDPEAELAETEVKLSALLPLLAG